ncbi:hypothetical protein [Streptomyces poonensis]|uniref:Secreted protein n=1 Tax=Streptomyces poonensis TaxID=68255 RepID=A0A918PQP3_9ACTN|nr:hypothetical protein [Streptomyces poonensis]GGZ18580.1 hypothetical protein GCM10010365_43540 [Streptomyces poonensis]GLJ90614.1 hypothetical protein GCM10017589_32190 [Streptomyces poonensis]
METVIAVMALIFVLFLALGAYATVKVVGAAKRGVDRTISQARRTVEDTTLRAKSLAQPGPVGELAELRLRLRTTMRATQDALEAGVAAEDESLKETLALFARLSAHGHELDAELRRLESGPDRAKLTERLPVLRERTERITKSADDLRWAAHDRARRFADDDLDTLSAQIDVETGALRHWTSGPASPTDARGAAPVDPPPWPEAPAPEAAASGGQTWPETPEARTAEEPTRPAINPPGPRTTYPWQKKPRPESTT